MKFKALFLPLFLFININVIAQTFIADDTKLYQTVYGVDYTKFDYKEYDMYRRGFKNLNSNGESVKENKKYKRIDFSLNGVALYSIDVKYKSGNWAGYFPNCNMYYASNNQLYYEYSSKNDNNLQNPVYYEDGSFWNGIVEDEKDPGVFRFIVMSSDGNKLVDKPIYNVNPQAIPKEHPKYKRFAVNHVPAKNPAYYIPWTDKKDRYYGYDQVGSYYSRQNNLEMTGIFYPTKFRLGNGSVLYMEDKLDGKNYWVVLLDNEIKFKLEATPEEKPDVLNLVNKLNFEVYRQHNDLATLVSKNIETLTGYGVNLVPQDKYKIGDGSLLEVGQFKNGKLHGVGYKANMVFTNRGHDSSDNLLTINAVYGMFENGEPVSTRTIVANKVHYDMNFWDVSPIEGFTYMGEKPLSENLIIRNNPYNLEKLKAGDEVYLENIKRFTTINNINKAGKFLLVNTDEPNIKARIDGKSGAVFAKIKSTANNSQSCETSIKTPIYKQTTELAYTIPAKYTSNSYTVKGVYFDKVVRESSYTPVQKVYKDVKYIDGYTSKVCPICNGTGTVKLDGTTTKFFWKSIQF